MPEHQSTEYQMKEVIEKTKVSKSTLVRWEQKGIFPKPRRRARTKARIYTDEHIQKITEYRDRTEEPPADHPSKKKR